MKPIRLTSEAKANLGNIKTYIAKDSKLNAARFIKRIRTTFKVSDGFQRLVVGFLSWIETMFVKYLQEVTASFTKSVSERFASSKSRMEPNDCLIHWAEFSRHQVQRSRVQFP